MLARYARALTKLRHPRNVSFEFSVEQLGLRTMEQTHRVYRSGLKERDETLVVDGYHLKAPSVRIIASRANRYEIDRVAPTATAYSFTFEGAVNESDAYGYNFATQARGTTPYAITHIEIDGRTFLPKSVRFRIAGGGVRGSGELSYALVDAYWLVHAASVSAHLPHGALAHETLRWSNYHFPTNLPGSTFEAPGSSGLPAATATPAVPAVPAVPAAPDRAAPPISP